MLRFEREFLLSFYGIAIIQNPEQTQWHAHSLQNNMGETRMVVSCFIIAAMKLKNYDYDWCNMHIYNFSVVICFNFLYEWCELNWNFIFIQIQNLLDSSCSIFNILIHICGVISEAVRVFGFY